MPRLLPYFKRAECHELGESAYHGGSGPLRVSRSKVTHPLARAWIEAGVEAGYPYNDDINGLERDGFGLFPVERGQPAFQGRNLSR